MKHISFYAHLLVIALVSFCFISHVSAESAGPGEDLNPKRLYSVDTVKTISGTVTEITADPKALSKKSFPGVIITLETPKKEGYEISLGPPWYFVKQGFAVERGDEIEVTGSIITFAHERVVLAATVKNNGSSLELRDRGGMPYWIREGR